MATLKMRMAKFFIELATLGEDLLAVQCEDQALIVHALSDQQEDSFGTMTEWNGTVAASL